MSTSLDQGWVHSFNDMIRSTYQQEKSLVATHTPSSCRKTEQAAIVHFDRIGNVVANDNPPRHGPTRLIDFRQSRRACIPTTSDAAVALTNIDEVRSLNNPQSPMTQGMLAALRRREDLHWISAALGSASIATVGTTGTITYTTQALLTANSYDATGGSTALILADIIKANKLLSDAAVPYGADNRLAFYSPGQLTDILAITQASSSDFTRMRIHEKGTINGEVFEGFKWIEIPDCQTESGTLNHRMLPYASSKRSVIFCSRDAVGLNVNQDIQTQINVRADMNNEIQVRLVMTMGAVRIWEKGVVQVLARDV
jgi:hypothetical protein